MAMAMAPKREDVVLTMGRSSQALRGRRQFHIGGGGQSFILGESGERCVRSVAVPGGRNGLSRIGICINETEPTFPE